jgi:hypothetical protein
MKRIDYPFTEQEMIAAAGEWSCNCGPSALAFALQIGLDKVRGKIPGFEVKGYTSPTMMKAALANLGKPFDVFPADVSNMFRSSYLDSINLVRVQWTGPWTKPGANPKWAYRASHWIASWVIMEERGHDGAMAYIDRVFDCNGGIRSFETWKTEIVPLLTALYPRADGGWFPTHVWRIAL